MHSNQILTPTPKVAVNLDFGAELEVFPNLLNSVDCGVALVSENFTLLYNNSSFNTLIGYNKITPIGERVFLNKGLKKYHLLAIQQQLNTDEFWQGIFPELGRGVKANISRVNFSIPPSASHLKDAYYIITLIDYSDFLKQQKAFSAAKRLSEKAEKEKLEFYSKMTHELRTPLNAVIGFTQLLKISDNLSIEQNDNLEEINSASGHLLKLINEILDLSKTKDGDLHLGNERISIDALMEECIELHKPLANNNKINILHNPSNIYFESDRGRIKQVLLNLISNAIKYNKQGGQVLVQSFLLNQNTIRIEIQDSGQGIESKRLNSIFSPFDGFADKDAKVERGIGLMLTRRLLNKLNGNISVVSKQGYGSIFALDLPPGPKEFSLRQNEHNVHLFKNPRRVLWVGVDNEIRQFAEGLVSLRPKLALHYTADLNDAILKRDTIKPDLIFINPDELNLSHEYSSSKIKNLLQESTAIAVIDSRASFKHSLDKDIVSLENISNHLNTIDFMRIIDKYLYT